MTSRASNRGVTEKLHGEFALATGESVAMRTQSNAPATDRKPSGARPYETVGDVVAGRAHLVLTGETVSLEVGDF